uniref:CinA domain-containing protein n=1 Tax=Ascaris lumbricoides TaxID=6252 RepID=A0A0M3IXW6_ASCLU
MGLKTVESALTDNGFCSADSFNCAVGGETECTVAMFIRRQHVDVAIVTISPPDEHGNCTLGLAADCTVEAVRAAKTIIGKCTFDSLQSHLLMICT